jgi:hypothetical protein
MKFEIDLTKNYDEVLKNIVGLQYQTTDLIDDLFTVQTALKNLYRAIKDLETTVNTYNKDDEN